MIEIRSATQADAEAVGDVYLASRRQFLSYLPLVHSDDDVCRWIAQRLIPSGGVHVAVEGDRILGMMAISHDGAMGWIDQLYLHPSVVGQGLGSRFVVMAKGELGPPIRLYTFLANDGARRFYERHGFVAIAFGDGTGNEEGCPDVLYEWRG